MSQPPSTANYVILSEEGNPLPVAQAQPAVPQVQVVVVETVKRRKRSVCGGCCCLALAVLVLLLALFVPRSPAIHFGEFVLGKTSSQNYNFLLDLKFKSRQPVKYQWDDLDVKLEWRTATSDDVTEVEVARFKESKSFKTKAYGSKRVYPELKSINAVNTGLLYASCVLDEVEVRLKGHVTSESTKFSVKTPWTWVIC
mmetsp:Transcript_2666/g.6904  ORF Transcript_2666/g.6904 Transcript_2666/m.6904 type:complete len:198 (-) Transcript_2666:138-731(-)